MLIAIFNIKAMTCPSDCNSSYSYASNPVQLAATRSDKFVTF